MAEALDGLVPDFDLGGYATDGINALRRALRPVTNAISDIVGDVVTGGEDLLNSPPVIIMIVVFALIALVATRSWGLPVFTLVSFGLIASMDRVPETMQTLSLVLVAAILAVAIGVPFGILGARSDKASTVLRPILDFMQTMPTFIYLLLAVFFFSVGRTSGVIASLVFAMPPAVRLTELGIRQVDAEVVEAAEAFGASPREVLLGVQLPLARPTIMAGVNQVIMLALSMVVIAGLGGSPGLGALVVRAVQTVNIGMGVEGGLSVVILAIFLDRVTSAFGNYGSRGAA